MGVRTLVPTIGVVCLSAISLLAQGTGIREVSVSERSLIPLQTKLRYTTMIVLPEDEEILDLICGDRDFWVISATQNIAHVKPAKEGALAVLQSLCSREFSSASTSSSPGRPGSASAWD